MWKERILAGVWHVLGLGGGVCGLHSEADCYRMEEDQRAVPRQPSPPPPLHSAQVSYPLIIL